MLREDKSDKLVSFQNWFKLWRPYAGESKEGPWCPLLGVLPSFDADTPRGGCVKIILEARKLWDIETSLIESRYPYKIQSIIPGEVVFEEVMTPESHIGIDYSQRRIDNAAVVFKLCKVAYAEIKYTVSYLIDDYGEMRAIKKVVSSWKDCLRTVRSFCTEIEDHEVIAMLAIVLATDLLGEDEPEYHHEAIIWIKDLLSIAENGKKKPDYELGVRRRNQMKEWSGEGAEAAKKIDEQTSVLITNEFKRIKEGSKYPSNKAICEKIVVNLQLSMHWRTVYRFLNHPKK